ncbi:HypC/HybG/HupF family hydrogenase formation chaperone [Bellilinea sp.]|jgi:hydrogenase expression/formation protein HypC|uniref:HypC/HybG/HupF family hydrogenase formation chaperone n=1 Tax=Bellilinea sp. TaxID=2838785 RepID=UPI002ADD611E|nr:HypC/HybG/HupF family hydrogenase formation chaperone [Bellilinea sp.]
MCLGIPGKIVELYQQAGLRMAKIDFGGVLREACVETLPEAKVGDYAIIHAGFALNLLDEQEALETLALLRQAGVLEEELNLPSTQQE